ncbi:MAG: hypothetical protein PF569_02300 [Candidatus Woesearchaeota archaeon]|jgi:hypothetical protein|nr:hypothetical protein [Candidatus Woesearchaeota archaeon]
MKLSKDYFIEGQIIKAGTEVEVIQENKEIKESWSVGVYIDKSNIDKAKAILDQYLSWDDYDEQEYYDYIIIGLNSKDYIKVKNELKPYIKEVDHELFESKDSKFEDKETKGKIEETITVKVEFEDGNYLVTGINTDLNGAEDYYLGKYFNFGIEGDKMVKAVKVTKV